MGVTVPCPILVCKAGGGCRPDWRTETEAKVRMVRAGVRQSGVELQPGHLQMCDLDRL